MTKEKCTSAIPERTDCTQDNLQYEDVSEYDESTRIFETNNDRHFVHNDSVYC